jgi:DNA-directed RNA polymerase specialized sigma24 family protein
VAGCASAPPASHEADDLLQDLFVKALRQGPRFCQLQNARAWLFEVARNALTDRFRVHRDTVDLPENLTQDVSTGGHSGHPDGLPAAGFVRAGWRRPRCHHRL